MDDKQTLTSYIVNKVKTRKKELIAVLILVIVALLLFVCIRFFVEDKGKFVKVYVNNKLSKTFDLNLDTEYLIDTKNGYNLLIIKDGKVKVADADCPNKICMEKGTISKNDESIICLPHNVVITVESNEEKDMDALAN